jgi:hypothetical protein
MYNAGGVSSLTAGVGIAPGWWGSSIPSGEWYHRHRLTFTVTDKASGQPGRSPKA